MGGRIAVNFALARPERMTALVVADTGAGSDETGAGSRLSTPPPTRRCRIRSSPGTSLRVRWPGVHPLLFHDPPCLRPGAHGPRSPGQANYPLLAGAAASRPRGAHTPDRRRARQSVRQGPPFHRRHVRRSPVLIPSVGHLTSLKRRTRFNPAVKAFLGEAAPPDTGNETAPSFRRCPAGRRRQAG